MGVPAGSSAAVKGGRTADQKPLVSPDAKVARDLFDAWRLAFVVVADEDLATRAVTKAFVDASPGDIGDPVSSPSRLELLAATFRISLTRAAESPDRESDSAVTAALWQLPAAQRGALWLAKVDQLDDSSLGAVLGVSALKAGHVATRAAEWLDVALDQESGPLCSYELRLADFINGHLPADEAAELGEHLPDCPTCQTKSRAFEELADLKAVMVSAVPVPPAWLTIERLEQQERAEPSDGPATLAEQARRTLAVRPLAACCAALLIVGLIGVALVRPTKKGADPVRDPSALIPGSSATTPANAGFAGSSADLPAGSATTVVVTTSSLPAVTFPTIPPGGVRKSKP